MLECYIEESFRLLTEYHSFLLKYSMLKDAIKEIKFPSPYGVSFILINERLKLKAFKSLLKFPSPYGVSFILIYGMKAKTIGSWDNKTFPSPYGVSFILMSKNIRHLPVFYKFPSPYGVSFILI